MATALAEQHQRRAELLAETVGREVRTEARKATTADIDGWFASRARGFQQLVGDGFELSARLGADYIGQAAAVAGFPALEPVVAALDAAQMANALRIVGPVAFKQAMARTGDADVSRRIMADRMEGTAFRLARAGDRGTFFATADANPSILIGYRRVAESGACDFCKMLEGRGAVYLSARSAGQVVGQRGRIRGTRALGRSFHDHCRCRVEEIWGQPDGTSAAPRVPAQAEPPPAPEVDLRQLGQPMSAQQLVDRAGVLRRRNRVDRLRAEAAAERAARLNGERTAAGATGKVEPQLLQRYQVTEAQYLTARALTRQIKSDIRAVSQREADDLGNWLFNNELDHITRPTRLRRQADISGRVRSVRDQSGYDWMEQLDDAELRRVRARMVDDDIYTPDVLAGVVRAKTGSDMSDDEALQWLVEQWLHEDALRSLASGRLPKYAEPSAIMPPDYAMEGYDLARLFGVDDADAIGHVAQVQAQQAATYADRILGRPTAGPAPWEMDTIDYVSELEDVERILADTQIAAGIDPGPEFRWAQQRIRELVPEDLDTQGATSAEELLEAIRVTAQLAGRLGV
jgi:hypothetical protein